MPRPLPTIDSQATHDDRIGLEAAPGTSDPTLVYDPSILVELEGVFGHHRLIELLGHLKEEIEQWLLSPGDSLTDLRKDAHALLSVSGSLGFFEFSRRCVEMERACRLGADPTAHLGAARAAARGAIAAIDDLAARTLDRIPAVCVA